MRNQATITESDFVDAITDGFQFISSYHPRDFVRAMADAYRREQSAAARNAIGQILQNSRMAAEGRRPICQDTGMAVVSLEVGRDVVWDSARPIEDMVNEGIRRAYLAEGNPLRASIVDEPLGRRQNTRDNTPGVVHVELVPGDHVRVHLAAKGFGSENKSRLLMLNPHDDFIESVLAAVEGMGAGWCPPGMLGIGVGGTSEKAMLLARQALFEPIDLHEVVERGPRDRIESLRLELVDRINRLGIGAQGLGGLTTVLDVKIREYPTHAGALPVGIIPNCAATRHLSFVLDGRGVPEFTPPQPSDWPELPDSPVGAGRTVDLDTLDREAVRSWKAGETLYLTGKLLTGRDAAHARMRSLFEQGESLPAGVSFDNRLIYYVGPVPRAAGEVIGPAGPTTSSRMDDFTELMLSRTGLLGMVGKAERNQATIDSLREHGAVYLIAVGGAAYLISKSIRSARVVAFEDLGMEAIHEFEVEAMPVIVAVDSRGESIHRSGPQAWRRPLTEAGS